MPSDRPSSTPPTPDTPLHDAHARLALHAAGMGLWEWDVPGGLFTIDARFAELLGRPELTAAPFDAAMIADMTHPADREMVAAELSKVLERDEYGFETMHRGVTPDGAIVWLRARAAVVEREPEGAPRRVAGVVEDCTATQNQALEREAERRRAELVLEAARAGVFDWEIETDTLYWSPSLREMLGVPADEVLKFRDLKGFVDPVQWAAFETAVARHITAHEPFSMTLEPTSRDGRVLVCRLQGQTVRAETGEPVRVVGSMADITDETLARRAAAEADARAQLALDAAGLILVEQDLSSGEVPVTEELAAVLGRPELAGRSLPAEDAWAHLHPEDRERLINVFKQFAAGALSHSRDEFRIVRDDGEELWLLITTVRPANEDGTPGPKTMGVVADLTKRKRAELALAEEKDRYDLAVAGAQMGIWEWNPDDRSVTWSARFNEILGLPADYPGESIEDFNTRVHPDDAEAMADIARRAAQTGQPFEDELRIRNARTGEWMRIRSRASARPVEGGTGYRYAGTVADVTALHEARRRADMESRRLQLALEVGGLAAFDFNFETGLMHGSPAVAEVIGDPRFSDAPIPLGHLLDIIHPEDRPGVLAVLENARTGARDLVSEHRIIRPDGEVRWTLTLATPTAFAEDGSVVAATGVVQDLTDRKRSELALAVANDRFERAVDGSLIAIWDWDIVADRVYWSRRMYEILGLDPETERIEMIGDITPMVHPDDLDALRMAQARHFEHGAPFELEYRMIRADGVIVRLFARGAATRDADGAPVRFVGSLIDVTAQHAAEEAARISGVRAQYALEAASLGLWEYDARTGAIVMDARLASLLGRPELADSPLDQDTVFKFTAKEDLEAVKARFVSLNSGEVDVVRSEHRIVDADGRRIWILAHIAAPERDDEGRPTRLIGITQDLTARKAIEDDLRNAKERAEAANAAKSAFLATMSHEIRTPLNGVLGMAQLLTLSELDDKQRRYTETILSSGRSLAAIIDDVLDISRIEAGRLSLKLEATKPAEMIDAALEPLKEQAQTKGLVLTVELETGLEDERLLDPVRMGQVLRNLIVNAIKFTPAGQVQVRAASGENNVIRFEVEDEGPGITPDLQASIFERFTQADMSAQRSHGGAGLGLAIARELTELAGGRIGVESEPGAGAVFWFEIPAPRPGEHPVSEEREGGETIVPDGASVLVVEDHPVNRAATAELLACAGFEVREADTADAALAALQAGRFDAVLLDLHMPGRGGDSVLTAIRRGEAGPADMPAFLLTADATPQARDAARDLKADGYFVKPADFDDIRRRLAAAILRARG